VDELVDTSTWQYAVISVRSEPAHERLVIAYPDENTLRDLIAAPSIVALGYTSRADALKHVDRCVTTTASLKRPVKTASLYPNMTFVTECRTALRQLAGGFGLSGTSQVMRNLLHNGFAAALIFFYSKMYCARQLGLLSLFVSQQAQGKLAFLHFILKPWS
jgi:hypothetical protein